MLTDRKGTQFNFVSKNSEHCYSMLEEAACLKRPGAITNKMERQIISTQKSF